MSNKVLLAVDLSNQLYKACAMNPTLSSEDRFTGGLFGFILSVQKAISAVKANRIVLCCDSKPYIRSKDYPQYKLLRNDKKDPDLVERVNYTKPLLIELAAVLGWSVWSLHGFESDDLIAHCMTQHRWRYKNIVAMSNDSDLYQLFRWPQFLVYKGKKGVYKYEDYQKEWKVSPEQMSLLLSMTGTHNEVEGITGIGPKTALDIINSPAKLRFTMSSHGEIIERNLKLITLPYRDFPKSEPIPQTTKKYSERDFVRFCSRFDIDVSQSVCNAFSQIG